MEEKVRRDLQLLDEQSRWMVVTHWRLLLINQNLKHLPAPIKIGIINTVIIGYYWLFTHFFDNLPVIFIPIIWTITYVLGLSFCILFLFGLRRQHWVK